MNELLPCPFCGRSKNVQLETDFRPKRTKCNWSARVICLDCFGTVQTRGFEWTREAAENEAITAWNRRAEQDARQLALKTRVCPMCEDCPDGCPVETPKDSRNIVTNADRIRSMTDEELAQFLGDEPPYFATYKQYIDWLRKPIESEVEEE